jgi:hypothetical protein
MEQATVRVANLNNAFMVQPPRSSASAALAVS